MELLEPSGKVWYRPQDTQIPCRINRPFKRLFFGLNQVSWPNGPLSPIACHKYSESYDTYSYNWGYLETVLVHPVMRHIVANTVQLNCTPDLTLCHKHIYFPKPHSVFGSIYSVHNCICVFFAGSNICINRINYAFFLVLKIHLFSGIKRSVGVKKCHLCYRLHSQCHVPFREGVKKKLTFFRKKS